MSTALDEAAAQGPVSLFSDHEAFEALTQWLAAIVTSEGTALADAVADLQSRGVPRRQVRAELKRGWEIMLRRQGLDDDDEARAVSLREFAARFEAAWKSLRPLKAADPRWMKRLTVSREGTIKAWHSNLELIIRHVLPDTFRWNAFAGRVELMKPPPWPEGCARHRYPREAAPEDFPRLQSWCQRRFEVNFPELAVLRPTVASEAKLQTYDPLVDYLEGLTWDGVERCETWLSDYFNAPGTAYVRGVGRAWLIQAVRRAFEPGCLAQYVLVLEGPQGGGKSRALRALAVRDEWFADSRLNVEDQRAAGARIQGKWIYELAEFPQRKTDADKLKDFVTNPVDRFRDYYGRDEIDRPRRCVFAATINPPPGGGYLMDPTGARRFWPVPVEGRVDVEGLARLAPQLWAEATARYRRGELAHLDEELEQLAKAEQAERAPADPWVQLLLHWREYNEEVTTKDVLTQLALPAERQTKAVEMRAATVLRDLGYSCHDNERVAVQGRRLKVYRRKAPPVFEHRIRLRRRRENPAQLSLPFGTSRRPVSSQLELPLAA